MAELSDILQSGDIPEVNADELKEKGVPIGLLIAAAWANGVGLPEITPADAQPNSIFFNTENARVSWKSPEGTTLRFQLLL